MMRRIVFIAIAMILGIMAVVLGMLRKHRNVSFNRISPVLFGGLVLVLMSPPAAAQSGGPAGRRFYIRGYSDFLLALPHHEIGYNLLRIDLPETGGLGDNFGRYAVRGEVRFGYRISETRFVREIFLTALPHVGFGRTIPQRNYTWHPDYIGHNVTWRFGISLPKNFEVYWENGGKWNFSDKKAVPPDGPFSLYNAVAVRWNFNVDAYTDHRFYIHGYSDFLLALPHNEISYNLRRIDLPETGGFGDNFGRYAVRGEVGFGYRISKTRFVREIFLTVLPHVGFGRTIPQRSYTWHPDYIGHHVTWRFGISLPKNFEVYWEKWGKWNFSDKEAFPREGPFGTYNAVVLRWNFNGGER